MPVQIRYMGRLGNAIIEYATARMFAEDNDLLLETPWAWPNFFHATPCASGAAEAGLNPSHEVKYDDKNAPPRERVRTLGARHVFMGYFQNADRLWPNRDRIRKYFRFPQTNYDADGRIQLNYSRMVPWNEIPKNPWDLYYHCRMTDGATLANLNHIVHPEWHAEVLRCYAKDFRRVVCITDDPAAWNYFNVFKEYGAIIKSQTVPEDFIELMTAENIVQGPSTFSWTASLLGHAKMVIQHDPFITIPGVKLDWPGAIHVRGGFMDGRASQGFR